MIILTMMQSMLSLTMTSTEIASYLKVHPRYVLTLIRRGLPAKKIYDTHHRYVWDVSKEDLDAWLNSLEEK